jgi:hypothetical protein
MMQSPRNPGRLIPWSLALFALGSSCTGTLTNPAGSVDECEDCTTGDGEPSTGDGDGDGDGDTDRPSGVGDPNTPDGVGWSTRFPKLTNQQWENSVKDLFRLEQPTGFSSPFTKEAPNLGYGPTAAAEVTIGGTDWGAYQSAAEKVAALVLADDTRLARILPQGSFANDTSRAQAFISNLGLRAYRRPLSGAELEAYTTLFGQGPSLVGGDTFKAGVQLVIEAMLQSPHFLYRVESAAVADAATDRKAFLSGYEIATRLSYALWDTTPSDTLLEAAKNGELDTKEGVGQWAEQMLSDPQARQTLLSFHEQTFAVADYGKQAKDPALGFDADALAPTMREEARRFFEQVILEEQGGITQILTEPVAYVNETTAKYYGLSGVTGSALTRMELDPNERAGLLTQLGFLTKNATSKGSDPVHRGLTVLRKVLCDEPNPPPMMFELPVLEPGLTTREVYEKATACGKGCHDTLINPPGFAFELFDTLGQVRETDQGKPVDTTGTLLMRVGYTPEQKAENPTTELSFDGAVDLVTKLADEPRVHECYARNWMNFVLARELDAVEKGAWEALRATSMSNDSARDLVISLVQLDTFRSRVSE